MFKNKPLSIRKTLVKAMVSRMAQAYGIKKKALVELIDCQRSVINNWGYYGRIPYEHLDNCHEETGESMDWLLYGERPAFEVSGQKFTELQQLTAKLFTDGCDFNMISENYPGANRQLSAKLEQDLLKWLDQIATGIKPVNTGRACVGEK